MALRVLWLVAFSILCISGRPWANTAAHQASDQASREDEAPLRVITSFHYPPFSFVGPHQAPRGFDIDLIHLVALKLGKKITLREVPFEELLTHLSDGRADIAIDAITPTAARKERADFTDPYFHVPNCALTRDDASINDENALRHKVIAVQRGSTQTGLVKLMKDQGLGGRVLVTNSLDESAHAVKSEEADLAIMECASAQQYTHLGNHLKTRPLPLKRIAQPIAIALPKNSPYRDPINKILHDFDKKKLMDGLAQRWFGDNSQDAQP